MLRRIEAWAAAGTPTLLATPCQMSLAASSRAEAEPMPTGPLASTTREVIAMPEGVEKEAGEREPCADCGGYGEWFGHAPDCDNDLCALAGGYDDCRGQVVTCHCQPQEPLCPK